MIDDSRDITVLTRFHSIDRLSLLDEALFSLLGQNEICVKSRILCQNLGDDDFDRVQAVCHTYRLLGLDISATNELFDRSGDHRSEILNRGMSRLDSRYLAFLDCDDIIYPSCYKHLIKQIEETQSSIVFGRVKRSDCIDASGHLFVKTKFNIYDGLPKLRFFIANQYPIHSFVIDLRRIDRSELFFDVGKSRNEDYAFLVRLLRKYEFDVLEAQQPICEYRVNLDGGNTILAGQPSDAARRAWQEAEEDVLKIKNEDGIRVHYRDLIDLIGYQERAAVEKAIAGHRTHSVATLDFPSVAVSEATRAVKKLLLKRIDSPENRPLRFHIDRILREVDGNYLVEGWCSGGPHRPLVAKLIDSTLDIREFIDRFHEREDVCRELQSDDLNFGFAARIGRVSNFRIIALCLDGNIYQSKPIVASDGQPKEVRPRSFRHRIIRSISRNATT